MVDAAEARSMILFLNMNLGPAWVGNTRWIKARAMPNVEVEKDVVPKCWIIWLVLSAKGQPTEETVFNHWGWDGLGKIRRKTWDLPMEVRVSFLESTESWLLHWSNTWQSSIFTELHLLYLSFTSPPHLRNIFTLFALFINLIILRSEC